MKAAIYARVSTVAAHDPDAQFRELREYCVRRGWKVDGEDVDVGFSGATGEGPQLDQLLARCRKRLFDAVVVCRYDRFARSLRHAVRRPWVNSTLWEFSSSRYARASPQRPQRPFGIRDFREHRGILARADSGSCSVRLAAARAWGNAWGGPRRYVDVRRIAALRADGHSWRDIGRALGVGVATARAAFGNCAKAHVRKTDDFDHRMNRRLVGTCQLTR